MRALIIVALCAQANATPASRLHYDAAWFARFTPSTALDMVIQTPGFVLIEPKEERRGYAGAVGNVLVDGARPSAKDQTLTEILQRIPAAQVVRIEILRGVEAGADASGQSVLANVVRTRFSGQGIWSGGFERAAHHSPAPNATLAWAGRVRSIDYGLGAATYSLRRDLPGERQRTDGNGAFIGRSTEESPRHYEQYLVNGELSANLWGGRAMLTGRERYTRYHHELNVDSESPTGAFLEEEQNPYTESRHTSELGANFERPAGDWDLTLVALLTRTRFDSESRSARFTTLPAADSTFAQLLERDSGESILRTSIARAFSPRHRVEIALEGALNTLDARLNLDLSFGGVPFEPAVLNGNVNIEERRGDAFVAHIWRPNSRWSLESRLAGELSHLSFSGDTNQSVHFSFAKPSMQLVRTFGAHQARVRVERDVGQLDFTDFVAAASAADNRIDGGNPDLRPETSWLAEVAGDFRLRQDLVLGLTFFRRWIDNAIDLIPVPDGTGGRVDAPGNVGPARAFGMTLGVRAPVPPLPHSTLTFDATWSESEVTDPVTGQVRAISEFERAKVNASFRQDLARLAWGVSYKHLPRVTQYRLREIDGKRESPSLDVFTELSVPGNLRLKLAVVSLLGSPGLRNRTLYLAERSGAVDHVEATRNHPGRWFQLFLSGSF